MRVLNVISQLGFGGAELMTIEVSRRMSAQGVAVSILVLGPCEPALVARIVGAGLDLVQQPTAPWSPSNPWCIWRLVRAGGFDVVHVHLFPSLYWAALASVFAPGATCWIYTEHSTSNRRRGRGWLKPIESWMYGRYATIACINQDVRAALAAWLPGLTRLVVVENGVDLARFADAVPVARDALDATESDTVVLMAGAFRTEKNQAGLVRSLLHLPEDYRLVLAGTGPELERVRALTAELGLGGRVRFLGAVDGIERVMKAADVYVLPSLFEGFGLSAVEAAAAGLPVVYADVEGLNAVFAGAGVAVDPSSPRSIADGIRAATCSVADRSRLARSAQTVAQRYDIGRTVERYQAAYSACSDGAR